MTLSATSRNRCWDLFEYVHDLILSEYGVRISINGADRPRSHALRTKLWSLAPSRRVQVHIDEQEV